MMMTMIFTNKRSKNNSKRSELFAVVPSFQEQKTLRVILEAHKLKALSQERDIFPNIERCADHTDS